MVADPLRSDKVGQATVRASRCLGVLLTQPVPDQGRLGARGIAPQHNIVAARVGRIKANDGVGRQPAALHEAAQHALAVTQDPHRFFAYHGVFQDGRVRPGQIPGLEERAPVYKGL